MAILPVMLFLSDYLPLGVRSLGPGSSVEEKGEKRGQIGKISASEASLAMVWGGGKGRGAWREAVDAAVPYHILVSCSDWSNVFMLTDSRCC